MAGWQYGFYLMATMFTGVIAGIATGNGMIGAAVFCGLMNIGFCCDMLMDKIGDRP